MRFKIKGGKNLSGKVHITGAKNAALKILPATLLATSSCTITNVPDISDVRKLLEMLESMGAQVVFKNNVVHIDPAKIVSPHPNEDLVKKLRGSVVLLGPLLARFGEATFSQPGGCLIGSRPIDDHLDVFKQMGVKVEYKNERFYFKGKPRAGHVVLGKLSVTATENAMMAGVLSPGITTIHVAAAEPEVEDLARMLGAMGARIQGAGTHQIRIEGVERLEGIEYEVIPDRIEAGTYLIAGIATQSEIIVGPVISHHNDLFLKKLKDVGACFDIVEKEGKEFIKTYPAKELIAQNIDPRPYPGFPTDLQPQYAVLMTQARGRAEIFDTLFEGRFRYIEELRLMKARAEVVNSNRIAIDGPTELKGAEVSSLDIRGGAAVVLAGLIAQGETIINNVEFIDRGYENIDGKLRALGAEIERIG